MYKVEWSSAIEDLITPYHEFVLKILTYVNEDPQFKNVSQSDAKRILEAAKEWVKNDPSEKFFLEILSKTDLPKYICNLKYENRNFLEEYNYFTSKYSEFLNKEWEDKNEYNQKVKDAFNYFYESLIHSKVFNEKFLNSNVNGIHEFRRNLALKKTCPYCDLHEIEFDSASVDHFIPKSKYPLLAIYPKNLVVSCTACNDRIKKEELFLPILHPYYSNPSELFKFIYSHDNNKIIIKFTHPISKEDKYKLANFFKLFNLKFRYNTNKNDIYEKLLDEIRKGIFKQLKHITTPLTREKIKEIISEEIIEKEIEVRKRKGIESITKLKADLYAQIKDEETNNLIDYYEAEYIKKSG